MGFKLKDLVNPKNLIAIAAAPVTAGLSLGFIEDSKGNTGIDYLTGAKSAREQNEKNIQYQKEANKQNIAMQKEINEISIDLANTAHQREIADLQKAGLNPVLSAQGIGAITPTLGTAQAIAPQVQNEMPGGYLGQIQSAVNIMGGIAQAQNFASNSALQKAQAQNTMVDTKYMPEMKKAEIAAQYANAGNARAQADYTKIMKDIDKDIKKADIELKKEQTWDKHNENEYHKHTGTTNDMPMAQKYINSFIGAMTNPKAHSARPY